MRFKINRLKLPSDGGFHKGLFEKTLNRINTNNQQGIIGNSPLSSNRTSNLLDTGIRGRKLDPVLLIRCINMWCDNVKHCFGHERRATAACQSSTSDSRSTPNAVL